MRVRESAQFLLLERSWHRSQGKGGPMRVREAHNSFSWKGHGIGLGVKGDQMRVPLKPTADLIFFRLRLVGIYPVLDDSDGVGFETIR